MVLSQNIYMYSTSTVIKLSPRHFPRNIHDHMMQKKEEENFEFPNSSISFQTSQVSVVFIQLI